MAMFGPQNQAKRFWGFGICGSTASGSTNLQAISVKIPLQFDDDSHTRASSDAAFVIFQTTQ